MTILKKEGIIFTLLSYSTFSWLLSYGVLGSLFLVGILSWAGAASSAPPDGGIL